MMDLVWLQLLRHTLRYGAEVAPRGLRTKELTHHAIHVDMTKPILTLPARKIGYKSMAAEAAWILSGSDRLGAIEPYMPRVKEFSDDGLVLNGAYGPRFRSQLNYVVNTLRRDPDTRQGVMTTWVPNPVVSKDIPCTVALDFKLRDGKLHTHVFMRSSDQWLGVPYDVFSFTMMTCAVLNALNQERGAAAYGLGTLHLTAASSHLYEINWATAQSLVDLPEPSPGVTLPKKLWDGTLGDDHDAPVDQLIDMLKAWRDGPRPFWEHF